MRDKMELDKKKGLRMIWISECEFSWDFDERIAYEGILWNFFLLLSSFSCEKICHIIS